MHSHPRHLGAKVKTQRAMWQHAGDNCATFTDERAGYYLTTSTKSWHRFTLCSGTRGCGGAARRWTEQIQHTDTETPSWLCSRLSSLQPKQIKKHNLPYVAAHMLSAQGSKGHRRRAVHKLASEQATYVQSPLQNIVPLSPLK